MGANRILVNLAGILFFLGLITLSFLAGGREESGRIPAPQKPVRIVSLAPSITEVLFALGLDREIVGVTDFCDYPPAVGSRTRVGGFKGKSMEAIIGLSPDLLIGTKDGNEDPMIRTLGRLEVPVLTIQPSTLTGVIDSIHTIGQAVGREGEALSLAGALEKSLFETHARVKDAKKVSVLFVYGRDPLVLAGPGTFADDMIKWAGGVNVAADAGIPYPRFSMEAVIARSPEVIVEGAMGSESVESKSNEATKFWSRWESLPAVRSGRIVVIDEDLIARPGPRIFQGVRVLARSLHPDRFDDNDPGLIKRGAGQ